MRWISILAFLLVLLGTAEGAKKSGHGDLKIYSREWFDVNSCQIPITNYGEFGYRYGFWPKGKGEPYIFGAGLWIGAIKGGVKMVSCGYNCVGAGNDFMPGPPEHNADHAANPVAHPEDRVLFSNNDEDLALWPLRDSLGEPVIFSNLDLWCEYNDCWPAQHAWEPGTGPLNLHVRQLTFGWTTELYANMFFLLYEFENVGDEVIKDMYVGIGSDMDVGWADDDLTGCDVGRSLGYTYTPGEEPGWTSKSPYYVGVKFLQGPKADDAVYVAAPPGPDNPGYPNTIMDTVLPGSPLVLTAFTRCTRANDADNDEKRYLTLAGYNIMTDPPEYDPWQGIYDDMPADKRMIMGCGPFELEPGEIDTFLVGVMFSSGETGGLDFLKSQGDAAYATYTAEWVVPGAPPPPKLTAVPGDGKVTLIWDNSPEYKSDPFQTGMAQVGDTVYREYDFEGYRLWKSRTGLPGDWELLGEWDIANDITLLPGDMWIVDEAHSDGGYSVSGKKSNNEGLKYSYIDTDVLNGITYFYAITSFDFNTRGIIVGVGVIPNESGIWISQESGKLEVKCTPRTETGDFIAPTANTPVPGSDNTTNSVLNLGCSVIGPVEVPGRTYNLVWGEIKNRDNLPVYTYNIAWDTDILSPVFFEVPTLESVEDIVEWGDSTVTDTTIESTPNSVVIVRTTVWDAVKVDTALKWVRDFKKPFDGLMLSGRIEVNQQERNTILKITKEDTLVAKPDVYGRWDTTVTAVSQDTILVSDTLLTFFGLPDSIVIAEDVGDHTYDGDLVVSRFYSGQTLGNSWAHHGGADIEIHWDYYNGSPDSLTLHVFDLVSGEEIPYDNACGDNWCFGKGAEPSNDYITGTQTPLYRIWFYVCGVQYFFNGGRPMSWTTRPDSGDVWRIYSSAPAIPPFQGNVYTIETAKFEYAEESNVDMIKVVPNPYVIRADWDRSKIGRKIQFTHLPNKCTIRIYNLAGNLIRILEHESTNEKGGVEEWDILTEDDQIPTSGIYIYHISTPNGQEKIGKFALIR